MSGQLFKTFVFILLISIAAATSMAVAPHPDVVEKWKQDGVIEQKKALWDNFKANGGCAPNQFPVFHKKNNLTMAAATEVDTARVLVILVDFSDHPYTAQNVAGTVSDFDSILFSDPAIDSVINPTGSMTEYYMEVSYGQFYVVGDIVGWYRMPRTYADYTNNSSGLGGTMPFNAQQLARDAIMMADTVSDVDFSRYDLDLDGHCDGIVIIHAGPGAETTGSSDDIWSHKWDVGSPISLDGVQVFNYTMNPEEYGTVLSPIGVFCHEYGHFIGLPDLYDTSDDWATSEGLGAWSLMASGNYNFSSKKPAHFDPWCKHQVGFLAMTEVTSNLYDHPIEQTETAPVAYKLSNPYTESGNEYFIVENRQKTGFDAGLPGAGILIYHVDEDQPANTVFYQYMVGLEQADGLDQLAMGNEGGGTNRGDIGDPYPGFTDNRDFHEFTTPNSINYAGSRTEVGVWSISDSDSIMYADLDIEYSRPWFNLVGAEPLTFVDLPNNDGLLEPGETVQFFFTIDNLMRPGTNVYATVTSSNPGIEFTNNDITITTSFSFADITNAANPIEFNLPDTLTPSIDSFFVTFTTDSLPGIPGGSTYTQTFAVEVVIGEPNILVVDNDRGSSYENDYVNALYAKRVPAAIWDYATDGAPTAADLNNYDMVFWLTGDTTPAPAFTAADVAAIKQYLDDQGNLFLSSVSAAPDLHLLDSAFMANYLKANFTGVYSLYPTYNGVVGSTVGDGLNFFTYNYRFYTLPTLTILDGAQESFITTGSNICGLSYSGDYKVVFTTFGLEHIDDSRVGFDDKADLVEKVIDFFGGLSTSVGSGSGMAELPRNFELDQNYPNPFNPTTTISYTLKPSGRAGEKMDRTVLAIYNMLGQRVRTLVDEVQIPGSYTVEWDGESDSGDKVATGIYFYRLTRGDDAVTRKMMLLK